MYVCGERKLGLVLVVSITDVSIAASRVKCVHNIVITIVQFVLTTVKVAVDVVSASTT